MHNQYLENQILSADPLGLVRLLYAGAIDSLLRARWFLERGEILERSAAISKAMEIVLELQGSLDMERGGGISENLARLYNYIQERLIEANAQQKREPLEEALNLLLILQQGWRDAVAELPAPLAAEVPVSGDAAGWTL